MKQADRKRALVLRNPKARRGQESLDGPFRQLELAGIDVTIETFEALPEIARDIVRLRSIADLIVICGGDGSISSGAMAVMESRPARRSERKPVRFEVVVQGVPSRIIDVSKEGMRLEIPRLRKAAPPPPVFDVALPMLGVSLNVRRLWASTPPECVGQTIWYGGELSNNTKRAELAWLTLVDALPTSRASLEVQ